MGRRRQRGYGNIFRGRRRDRGKKQKGGIITGLVNSVLKVGGSNQRFTTNDMPRMYNKQKGGFGGLGGIFARGIESVERKIAPRRKQKGGAIGMGAMLALSMAPMLLKQTGIL